MYKIKFNPEPDSNFVESIDSTLPSNFQEIVVRVYATRDPLGESEIEELRQKINTEIEKKELKSFFASPGPSGSRPSSGLKAIPIDYEQTDVF